MPTIPEDDSDDFALPDFVLVDRGLPEEEFPELETIWTFIISALATSLFQGSLYH
jgi:hypothetical protein